MKLVLATVLLTSTACSIPHRSGDTATTCRKLQSELASQSDPAVQRVAGAEAPFDAANYHPDQRIAEIRARLNELHCDKPPPTTTVADAAFDSCYNRCRKYTDRTKEQCFDTCNTSCVR